MSDEHGSRPEFSWQDAFTSPSWQLPELDEAVLAPPLEDFGLTDFRAPRDLPRPPDVDQILRGEYTGWIPVIREGESLEQVQERQETLVKQSEVVWTEVPAQVVSTAPDEVPTEIFELVVEAAPGPQTSEVTHLGPQTPWLVVETVEYGSVSHDQVQFDSVSHAQVQPDMQSVTLDEVEDEFDDTFDTSAWSGNELDPAMAQEHHAEPIAGTLVTESTPTIDHSLELVIMRDEIQDLRNRLDASQKLVEEMMHKLAELAELALRSRM